MNEWRVFPEGDCPEAMYGEMNGKFVFNYCEFRAQAFIRGKSETLCLKKMEKGIPGR